LLAVPSEFVRPVARALGDHVDGRHAVVHGVRGLVLQPTGELATISTIVREETPVRRVGALGGPVLTDELSAGAPCVMVVASRYGEVVKVVRHALGTPSLRIYASEDLTGLEWASALTSILAVAVGFARAVGLGAGVLAAFVTRGVHEAARIAQAAGAEERTFLGLGGFGDLLAATSEDARPEIRLGEAVARGTSVEEANKSIGQRVEAIDLAPRVAEFAARHKVNAPIFTSIAHAIFAHRPPEELVRDLMMGPIVGPA
jgi:glycerol-3-phosphate dehydrogenase (NAD(P)+)